MTDRLPSSAPAPSAPVPSAPAPSAPAPSAPPATGFVLPRRVWWAFGAVVALLHGAVLFEALSLPFARGPLFDSRIYLAQAKAVLAGEHGHPTLLALSPLYGYWLALVDGVGEPERALVLQGLLGGLAIALTVGLARRLSGGDDRAALVAGALHAGHGWLTFCNGKLLAETLGVLWVQLGLWLLYRAWHPTPGVAPTRPRGLVLAGAALALAVLARASLVFALPLLVLAVGWASARAAWVAPASGPRPRLRLHGRRGARDAGALALGMALVLGARGLVAEAHTGRFVPVIMVSQTLGQTTVGQVWTGKLTEFLGREADARDVVRQAADALKRDPERDPPAAPFDVVGWLVGLPSKLWGTFADHELGFQYGYYSERSESPALSLLPVTFHTVLLLGVLGGVVCVRRRRGLELAPLVALALGALATTTLYHPSSRYRLGLVLACLPLAGLGAQLLWTGLRTRNRWRPAAALAAAVVAFSIARTALFTLERPDRWHLTVARSALDAADFRLTRERACAALGAATVDAASAREARGLLHNVGVRPDAATADTYEGLCGAPPGR